jgi:hypothetical protein
MGSTIPRLILRNPQPIFPASENLTLMNCCIDRGDLFCIYACFAPDLAGAIAELEAKGFEVWAVEVKQLGSWISKRL